MSIAISHLELPSKLRPSKTDIVAIITGLVLCLLYSHLYMFKAYVELEMDSYGQFKTVTRIYWKGESTKSFDSRNSALVAINPWKSNFVVSIGNLSGISKIRFDPIEYAGQVTLKKLRISQPGYVPIEYDPHQLAGELKPVSQIHRSELSERGLEITTVGPDPQFEIDIKAVRNHAMAPGYLATLLLIMMASLFIHRGLHVLHPNLSWAPACLLLVLVLATIMGTTSKFNTHPDERVHLEAVKYYSNNVLAPPLESPDIVDTFSSYGYTRLANYEVYYQLAGYYLAALDPLPAVEFIKARSFSWLLLVVLILCAVRNVEFRYFLVPLLISAQTWYLFTYTNSDGFALFISTLISYQVASRTSMLNRILTNPQYTNSALSIIAVGLLLGTLLVVKANHYIFGLFVGFYFFWRLWQGDFPNRKLMWKRLFLVGLVGLTPYGLRLAMDMHANGFSSAERNALKAQVIEQHAEKEFLHSTPLNERHIYLNFKEQGATVDDMIDRDLWLEKMYESGFGNYGYTQFKPIPDFFKYLKLLGFALAAVILFSVLLRGPPSSHWLIAITGLGGFILLLTLFLYSWIISFQPQGRYLAPLLPMAGVLYYEVRRYLFSYTFYLLIFALFLLGVYSFVNSGIGGIDNVDYRYFLHNFGY